MRLNLRSVDPPEMTPGQSPPPNHAPPAPSSILSCHRRTASTSTEMDLLITSVSINQRHQEKPPAPILPTHLHKSQEPFCVRPCWATLWRPHLSAPESSRGVNPQRSSGGCTSAPWAPLFTGLICDGASAFGGVN